MANCGLGGSLPWMFRLSQTIKRRTRRLLPNPKDLWRQARWIFRWSGSVPPAGGIQTLLRLFENMRDDVGMAFVVILHLSPKHDSVADQVLQRATKMRVIQVTTPRRIEKNCVYLISPSNNLSMEGRQLRVTHVDRRPGRPVNVDLFFRSLAEAHGERAIGIILSGSGSDGSVGFGRIKEFAGITIARHQKAEHFLNARVVSNIDQALVDHYCTCLCRDV
jgi:hypothetical protein